MPPIDDLEQRIDTNKNKIMESQEIINFLKNDKNVKELWEKLKNHFSSTRIEQQKNQKFYDAVCNTTLNNPQFQNRINSIITKWVWWITDTDVFLLYLQSKVDKFWSTGMIIITANEWDIYTRYGWVGLLQYIRTKYKNPKYEFWRWRPNVLPKGTTQPNNPKNPIEAFQKKEPELPNNISFDTFWENNTYMPKEFSKLDSWAKNNFPSEYNKEKIASKKRNAEKWDRKNDYIQLDLYRFSLTKYQELVEEKNKPIYNSVYGSKEKYEEQQDLAKIYFEEIEKIGNQYPNIEKIIKKISDYFNELETLQKKHLKNEKEEDVQKKYELYTLEVNQRGEQLWMKEAQESLKKEPKSEDDVIKYWENYNKLMEFENEKKWIKKKYGKSIDNYEDYLNEKWTLITKYWKESLQQWIDTYKQYLDKINECKNQNKWFNENRYKLYTEKLSESGLSKHFENIQALYNSINTKDGMPKNFPIRGIVEENERLMREQEETNRNWEKIKNTSWILYTILATWAAIVNTHIFGAWNSGAKLWALITYLWHDDDEMVAVLERTNNWFWNPRISYSTDQMKELYDAQNKEINFNRNNGPIIIWESIGNMLLLVEWWWAITKGLAKWAAKAWANMWTKLASRVWLVSSAFIQWVWRSFEEWFKAWMTWNQALLYGTTSALIQWSLELISPNEFINWVWKNLAKTYIKELLKTGSKQSLKAIGKAFLKNIWSEIFEENIQEAIQLVAGNLVNMWANDQYNIPKDNELDADRHRKNFAATALVTSLTTWIVSWWWFAMQTPWMLNNQSRAQLIWHIQKNNELHSDVMNVLDKAIAWNVSIPNISIQQLQDLKWLLNNSTNIENSQNINPENMDWETNISKKESETQQNHSDSETNSTNTTENEDNEQQNNENQAITNSEKRETTNEYNDIDNTRTRLKKLWIDVSRYNDEQISQITDEHIKIIENIKKKWWYDLYYFPIPQWLKRIELLDVTLKIFKNIPENLLPQLSEIDINKLKEIAELCGKNHNIFIFWMEDLNLYIKNIEKLKEIQFYLNINLNNLSNTIVNELIETLNNIDIYMFKLIVKNKDWLKIDSNIENLYKTFKSLEWEENKCKLLFENNIEINSESIENIKKIDYEKIIELCKLKKECEKNNIWLWIWELIEVLNSNTTFEDLEIIFPYKQDFKDIQDFNISIFITIFSWFNKKNMENIVRKINSLKRYIDITMLDLFSVIQPQKWTKSEAEIITDNDIEKFKILKDIWLRINITDIEKIRLLTENEISIFKNIKQEIDNLWIDECSIDEYKVILNIISTKSKKDYIKRKNEYLKNNQTLSNEQFNALFKPSSKEYKSQNQEKGYWIGKYWISDINQWNLWCCYAYTWFELLKKSNFFETFIKTSIKQTNEWWEVKIPLWDLNWHIIKVNKNEIDNTYIWPGNREIHINSNSSLWFKILEIAFIKEYIINNNKYAIKPNIQKARDEYKRTQDITITSDLLQILEWGHTIDFFKHIINNNIISSCIIGSSTSKEKKIAILNNINKWNVKVWLYSGWETIKIHPKKIKGNNGESWWTYEIIGYHVYSIERTYYDPNTNENIVVFVNPYKTSEKIHITAEECIKYFWRRDITTFNMDKIFNIEWETNLTPNQIDLNNNYESEY